MEPVTLRTEHGIGWITIDNPPVNALSAGVRTGLADALGRAAADPCVSVIVLRGAGTNWSAGADIHEFDKPSDAIELPDLCARIAREQKPVIAALHGAALGGGLELALAARLRIATASTQLGLPEVSLGLLPGAGGTQRLPRLIGAKAALGLMLSGLPVAAERAEAMGLVDAVVEGDLDAAAARLARAHIDRVAELPGAEERIEKPDTGLWLAAVADARAALGRGRLPAPGRIIDCVEAALLLPEDEGFTFERAAFADLVATPEAAALRHVFLAERRAAHQPGLDGVSPRETGRVGLIGGGTTGAVLATALLGSGCQVTLIEPDADTLAQDLALVAAHHDRAVESGRLTAAAREAEWDRIEGSIDLQELAESDLILLATEEDAVGTRRLLADLCRLTRPGTAIVLLTSALDVAALAAACPRPEDVLGLHLLPPVENTKLVEVAVSNQTAPDIVATGFALARRLGRVGVRATASRGFIGPRVAGAYRAAMDGLVEAGASPYEIDRAMAAWGFSSGPYHTADQQGLQAGGPPSMDARLLAAGRPGKEYGAGYYRYAEGARLGQEDAEALALIAAEREGRGIVARPVGMREIQRRALAAMANEGARMVAEGAVLRPSDVDAVMVAGYGFPRWRGGPMQAADQAGLLALRNDLRSYAAADGAFWEPSALWDDLIKNGRAFSDLDGA